MHVANVRRAAVAIAAFGILLANPASRIAHAVDYTGTVQFQGQVTFAAPIPGITSTDLTVVPGTETEATGNGEKCSVTATSADNPDGLGAYPDAGQVSADMLLERGGPNIPDGQCILTVRASGSDGVSVSARGSQTVFVDADTINTSGSIVVDDIVIRESKAIAGVDKDCRKFVKKQIKARSKCNVTLLKLGAAGAAKCKDFSIEEPPANCDPGNFVDAIIALAHGSNDQQLDPPSADDIDEIVLKDQITCQKRFGNAAAGFVSKRVNLVQKKCIEALDDEQMCRDTQTNDSKSKLDQISKCAVDQLVDGNTGRLVPDVAAPCAVCIDGLGDIDTRCLRSCFEVALVELSDGIIGDLPECGNGILQAGEFCDDGNLVDGDCCSDSCTVEAGSTEGPMGDGTCSDLLDNDCDTQVDAADTDCQ